MNYNLLIEPGLFNPNELPKLPKIKKAIVIGSGLRSYKEEFKSQYSDIELEYFEDKCSLASAIGYSIYWSIWEWI